MILNNCVLPLPSRTAAELFPIIDVEFWIVILELNVMWPSTKIVKPPVVA